MLFGKYINKYYLKYGWALILGMAALVFVDYLQLKIPEIYRMLINGINNGSLTMDLLIDQICLPLTVVVLCLMFGRFLWRVCFFGSAIKVETEIRSKMFDHALKLSHSYYQQNKVGGLMALYTNDLETVQHCFGEGVLMLCDAAILGGMILYKMSKMDVLLTLLSLIPMALLLIIGAILKKYMTLKWRERQAAYAALSDFSQENFSGIAVVKAFVKEWKELLAFRKLNVQNEDVNVAYAKLASTVNIITTLLVESVVCIIFGYGGYLVYSDKFDVGMLIEYHSYFGSIVWPIMAISSLIEMTSRGKASLGRITELLDSPVEVADRNVENVSELKGKIEFKNLSFAFPDDENTQRLCDMSFTIEAGENIGIIGATGSGKTTMVNLMLRIYNTPDGMLFFDDRDVNSIPIRTVRDCVAYVPQDNFLFSDTIANNIAFSGDKPREDIENAAKLADIHRNIIEFGQGYDTVMGERGVTVSGGQKQRISIARALMKNAPILILDDSVSAVDTATEKVILGNLRKTRKGKTTILIAHRVSTVEQMDKVLFIDDGRVKAFGTHEQLLSSCPEYAHTCELQRLDEEVSNA